MQTTNPSAQQSRVHIAEGLDLIKVRTSVLTFVLPSPRVLPIV